MIQFYAALQVLGAHALTHLEGQVDTLDRARSDRGSVTIEQVLWAVAVITISGIVIGVIINFVKGKTAEIK